MVSFTSITQCALLISLLMIGISEAAPTTAAGSASQVVPHVNATTVTSFTLPPIISSRTKPVLHPAVTGDLNAEAEATAKNKQWFQEHGGNLTILYKRDTTTVQGMTLKTPSNAPPEQTTSSNAVVTATSAQVTNFKYFAGIASTAYCSAVQSGSWNCANCLTYVPDGKLIMTFNTPVGNIEGFILRSDSKQTIYVAFRGTNSFQNWVVDLVYDKTDYTPVSGTQVHQGFYAAYTEAASYYFPTFLSQHNAYPGYNVVVTGHSLGGAEALLAGMDLYQRVSTLNSNNLSIYTVGCPRVGDSNFAYYVDSTGITFSRSVNNRDIVPHLPPEDFGFLHPGVEAWDLSYTNVQICTSDIESNSCSDSIVPFTSITDHLTYYGINEGSCL